jgi:ABC-2 type transport system permease protein
VSALRGLLRKEMFHILRDRRTLFVIALMPVVQLIIFGYAIRTDVADVRLAVVDPRPDPATLAVRARLQGTGVFRAVAVVPRVAALDRLFQSGAAQEAVVFEPGFGDRLGRGLPARVLIVVDATEPNSGSAMRSYAALVIQQYERELQRGNGGVRIVPQVRMRFNPTRASANLFVPGLIALVLTVISALMTALSLAREKETGTMEALLVSPLRPWQIIVGKVAPYLAIGFVSLLAVVLEAQLIFGVPFRGSLLLLLGEGLLFILTSLAFGILVSSRTSSQRVAMMSVQLATMLPTMLLSGFVFPIESMPKALQLISVIIPARWFVFITRGIMLKGVGLEHLWRETLVLAAMAFVLLAVSARSFRVRLE